MTIALARVITRKYSKEEIASCIAAIVSGAEPNDVCPEYDMPSMDLVNVLAKASVIKKLMDEGMTETAATRTLAKRMRMI